MKKTNVFSGMIRLLLRILLKYITLKKKSPTVIFVQTHNFTFFMLKENLAVIEVTLPWLHISGRGFMPNVRMFSLCLPGFVSGYSVFLPQAKTMCAKNRRL